MGVIRRTGSESASSRRMRFTSFSVSASFRRRSASFGLTCCSGGSSGVGFSIFIIDYDYD